MTEGPALERLVSDWGLGIIAPLAVVEGPVVTLVSGALVQAGLLGLLPVLVTLVLADLAGDVGLYLAGRHVRSLRRSAWLDRLGITRRRLARLVRGFRRNDARLLVLGKWTHAAGFAVLLAAGVAQMPPRRFVVLTLVATLPKTAVLLGIGGALGGAWDRLEGLWLWLPLVVAGLTLPLWLRRVAPRP